MVTTPIASDQSIDVKNVAATSNTQESDLDIVKRHVQNSQQRVTTQREVMVILVAKLQPTQQARELLQLFEETWQAHADHLSHVEESVRQHASPARRAGARAKHREAADQIRVRRAH